ncbi:CYtochrome P450 family [Aphelenchoides bicaudatus]|nr:CYtochrome P450 family [Aphelenchoides bicaudatus]
MEKSTQIILTSLFALLLWSLRGFFQWLYIYFYHQWMTRNFPGPKTLPLIGSAHLIKGGLLGFPEFLMREAEKVTEQGGILMRTWVGPILRVYLFDPEAIKVVTNSTTELRKGKDYDRLHPWLGSGLITASGDEQWRSNRKLLTPAFHFGKLEEYAEVIDGHARELVDVLSSQYADGKQHDIYNVIKCMTLDAISETAMGIQVNSLQNPDQEYIKAVDTYNSLVFFRGAVPIYLNKWIWKLSGWEKVQNDALKVLKTTSTSVIKKRIELLQSGLDEMKTKRDFLDILLVAHKEGRMNFEQMRQEVDSFLFAGYDTTAHAISWTIWYLATNPNVQEKLYREISEKLNGDADFCTNKTKELPYFEAVIKESLRIYPPVAGFARHLENDLQVGEYLVPKGANLMVSILCLHHNKNIFSDHWQFKPERFLQPGDYSPNSYIPFSAGLRNCIGQKFAMRELRNVIAHLVYNFRFSTDHKMLDNKPIIKVVLTPSLGVPVKLQSRN